MAVVVSPAQNEIEKLREKGLEIEPHRRRMNEQDPSLADRFKDPKDPLRLVFVCAMWLTGFDAPSASTLYLDKPMRNHTLMQTIARVNRVFEGKHCGYVMDYANVLLSLKQALAIYGVGQSGASPVKDKSELIAGLREALAEACAFCLERGVDVDELRLTPANPRMQRLNSLGAAVNRLASPDAVREKFFEHERLVTTIFRALKPDPAAAEFAPRAELIVDLALAVRVLTRPDKPDVSEVLGGISRLLDRSITGLEIRNDGPPPIDLSKVDFAELARRFRDSKTKSTDLEALKAAVKARLARVLRLNRTRTDFREKFESLIEEYNSGSRDTEQFAAELVELTTRLDEEEHRHVRESLTVEELVIFDILTRPAPVLSDEERAAVKRVAKEMLARVKELLAPHWREKAAARAGAKLAIEDVLDGGLPVAYGPDMFKMKVGAVFQHIYESYSSRDSSFYSGVA
jgi:type I restriction enzyme R subunit